jgi:hypothetical protein
MRTLARAASGALATDGIGAALAQPMVGLTLNLGFEQPQSLITALVLTFRASRSSRRVLPLRQQTNPEKARAARAIQFEASMAGILKSRQRLRSILDGAVHLADGNSPSEPRLQSVSAEQLALLPRCAECLDVWLPGGEERLN